MSTTESTAYDSKHTKLSVLARAQSGDDSAWTTLTRLYRPLIRCWAMQHGIAEQDADDLSQDVLLSVVKHLHGFEHAGRIGSFRSWLRIITVNRTRDFWRTSNRTAAKGDGDIIHILNSLEDPTSELTKLWEQQHNEFVIRSLMGLMELEFEPTTMQAFRRVALEGADAGAVAEELGMSLGAIYTARSRVLQRIRRHANDLLDFD